VDDVEAVNSSGCLEKYVFGWSTTNGGNCAAKALHPIYDEYGMNAPF
jgi:hypothetical protein